MAVYTTQLRSIVEEINREHNFQTSYLDPLQIIEARIQNARSSIFSFEYPINPEDKERFECNFIRHFYTREIGLETYRLWQLKLAAKLNLIIPKYNKLWADETKYKNYDLLTNSDYTTIRAYTGNRTLAGLEKLDGTRTDNLTQADTGIDTNTVNSDHIRAYSDTPQGNMQNLLNEKYLTNLTHDYENGSTNQLQRNMNRRNTGTVKNENDVTKSENTNDKQDETVTHKGKNGGITYAEALLKARETYLNIDLMLCNELRDLFMLIW